MLILEFVLLDMKQKRGTLERGPDDDEQVEMLQKAKHVRKILCYTPIKMQYFGLCPRQKCYYSGIADVKEYWLG